MKKGNEISLTEGSITKAILFFSLPILIGNIFQQLYNVVDTAIIGNVLGDRALAAVGATSAFYTLVIGFANGFTSGFSVVLARFYGADDQREVRKNVSLIYVMTFLIAVLLTVISILGLHPVLVLLKTPENILGQTEMYLKIVLGCSGITMFYNMFSAILRAIGNSKTPLYFLILSSVANVILDIAFVKYLGFGIPGAAYATVLAQVLSVVLCFFYVWVKCPILKFNLKDLSWDSKRVGNLLSMGFSMGLTTVVIFSGSVALQRAVNSLGEKIIAAHTAARKIHEVFICPLVTLSTTASTFTSQNLGAGKHDRIHKGVKTGVALSIAWSVIAILCIGFFGTQIIQTFTGTSDTYIIKNALMYAWFNTGFFTMLGIMLVIRNSLQGLGRMVVPVLGSVVEFVVKFGSVGLISNRLGYFGVSILEPIIWVISAVMVVVDYMVYRRGIKKNRKVKS